MKNRQSKIQLLVSVLTVIISILTYSNPTQGAVTGAYLYNLSNFTGIVPYYWTRVSVDRERNETYVLFQNLVRVFNEFGMEVYRFGDDLDLGHILDVAVDKAGDILLLSYRDPSNYSVHRCNYRGEPISKIEIKNLPPEFSNFFPGRMIFRNGTLYFASLMQLIIITTDLNGNFKKGYDIFSLIELEEKDRGNVEIIGFSVDKNGNILFTIPVLFRVYILSPEGKVTSFGKPGGAPGRFNIVGGIVADSKGNYLIVDKLKSAVMVFDKNYNFLNQFGYRGFKPGNLIAPDDIAIDSQDRIYVTQGRKRGVSVFMMTYN